MLGPHATPYAAIRAPRPDARQRQLIRCWLREATPEDFLLAWAEGVYTWHELAWTRHFSAGDCQENLIVASRW